jgi:hypothetical protein
MYGIQAVTESTTPRMQVRPQARGQGQHEKGVCASRGVHRCVSCLMGRLSRGRDAVNAPSKAGLLGSRTADAMQPLTASRRWGPSHGLQHLQYLQHLKHLHTPKTPPGTYRHLKYLWIQRDLQTPPGTSRATCGEWAWQMNARIQGRRGQHGHIPFRGGGGGGICILAAAQGGRQQCLLQRLCPRSGCSCGCGCGWAAPLRCRASGGLRPPPPLLMPGWGGGGGGVGAGRVPAAIPLLWLGGPETPPGAVRVVG